MRLFKWAFKVQYSQKRQWFSECSKKKNPQETFKFCTLASIPYAEASRDYVCNTLGQRERSGVPTGGDALEIALA